MSMTVVIHEYESFEYYSLTIVGNDLFTDNEVLKILE